MRGRSYPSRLSSYDMAVKGVRLACILLVQNEMEISCMVYKHACTHISHRVPAASGRTWLTLFFLGTMRYRSYYNTEALLQSLPWFSPLHGSRPQLCSRFGERFTKGCVYVTLYITLTSVSFIDGSTNALVGIHNPVALLIQGFNALPLRCRLKCRVWCTRPLRPE